MSAMVEGKAPERPWNRSRYPLQIPSRTSGSRDLEPPSSSQKQNQDSRTSIPLQAALESSEEAQQAHSQTADCDRRDENFGSEVDVKENQEGHRTLRRTKKSWQV